MYHKRVKDAVLIEDSQVSSQTFNVRGEKTFEIN